MTSGCAFSCKICHSKIFRDTFEAWKHFSTKHAIVYAQQTPQSRGAAAAEPDVSQLREALRQIGVRSAQSVAGMVAQLVDKIKAAGNIAATPVQLVPSSGTKRPSAAVKVTAAPAPKRTKKAATTSSAVSFVSSSSERAPTKRSYVKNLTTEDREAEADVLAILVASEDYSGAPAPTTSQVAPVVLPESVMGRTTSSAVREAAPPFSRLKGLGLEALASRGCSIYVDVFCLPDKPEVFMVRRSELEMRLQPEEWEDVRIFLDADGSKDDYVQIRSVMLALDIHRQGKGAK